MTKPYLKSHDLPLLGVFIYTLWAAAVVPGRYEQRGVYKNGVG